MKFKSLTAKLAALLCACGFAFSAWADVGASLQLSGTMTPAAFKTAVAGVATYDGQGVTVDFSDDASFDHSGDGPQFYVLGDSANPRPTDITISNVKFYAPQTTRAQLYLYTTANVTFENCIFDNVSVSMNATKHESRGTFTHCSFVNVKNYALKYVDNVTVSYCLFDACKRAVMFSSKKDADHLSYVDDATAVSDIISIHHCTFRNIKDDRIIKFYEILTDDDTVMSITDNTVESSCTAYFITVDFDAAETPANNKYTIAYTGNTGVNTDNLNEGNTEKTLYIDGDYLVDVEPVAVTYVAQIGDDKYETLQEAIAAASNGDTVQLLSDIVLTKDVHVTTSGENIYCVLVDGVYKYQVAAPKLNSLIIDGNGHTISMGANPTFGTKYALSGGGAFIFGKYGTTGEVEGEYTIRNVTFTGFDREIIRVGFATLNIENCTFNGNHLTETVSDGTTMIYAYQGALNVSGSTFTDNTVSGIYALIFSNNSKTAATISIDNNLFLNNGTQAQPSSGNGLIYLSNAASSLDAITRNTFESNYVGNASANAAVVYLSKPVETFSGNFFKDNTVNVTDSSKKEGVIVLGSGAAGTPVTNNAFVGNILSSDLPAKRATIVTGCNGDLSGNYWGDGAVAEIGAGNDIYIDGDKTISAAIYATSYIVNDNDNGVTVTPVAFAAKIGEVYYTTIKDAIVAAEDGDTIQLLPGTYGNVDLTHTHGRFQTETYQGGIFAPNVTILGGEGVTVDGMYFNGRIIPDNWTIKNVTFSGSGNQSGFHFVNGVGVSGLTVDGCKFLGGCFLSLTGGTAVNTVVTNCLFDGVAATGSGGSSAIYIPSPDGLTVTGCTIRNGAYNAIQTFPKTGSADVIITGNTFQGVNSRIINMANATTGHTGTITISGNTFYMPGTPKSDGNYVRCGKAISIGENTYEEDPSSDNWSYYFLPSDLTVTAGTYANDVSTHVAPGYKAVANGTNPETWTVVVLPTYTVTFDLNAVMAEPTQASFYGGMSPDSTVFTQGYFSTSPTTRYKYTVAVKEGETVPKPFNANGLQVFPVRRDLYIFDGWELNGTAYDFTTPVTSDITLTAKWKAYTDSIAIANAEEFLAYATMFSAGIKLSGVTATLTDDIAFTETLRPWAPLAGFSGTLDGANHKITGLNVNAASDYVGLFYQLNSGSICNLTIESPTIQTTGNHVGALAGTCSIPLNNVHVIGNISVTGKDNVGGISGKAGYGASYTNCSVVGSGIETAVISGTGGAIVGGLISETGNMANGPLTITGCRVSNVTVVGVRKIGGLIGQVDGNNLTCTDAEVSNVKLVSNAETSLNKDLPMGGFVGAFVNSRYTNDIFSGTVSDITMTGPAELSSGKNYIMGWVSGGTGGTVDEAETAMTGAGMTFNVTVSGTNTRTIENDSMYAGINGNQPAANVASITRGGVTTEYASAQEALDQVVSGDTITLYAGDHGTLYIRQNPDISVIVDVVGKDGDGEGAPRGNDRYRAFENVTIVGESGATLNRIVVESGPNSPPNNPYYTNLDSLMEIDNLTISGVTFNLQENGAAFDVQDNHGYNLRLTGLTIDGCTVNGTGSFGDSERLLIGSIASNPRVSQNRPQFTAVEKTDVNYTTGLSDLVVRNCTFNNLHQVMEVRNVTNLTFTGNTINGVAEHTIIALSDSNKPVSLMGTVNIANNTIDGTTSERVFRMNKANATVSITGNTITGYSHSEDSDLIKISSSGDDATYTITGNSFAGTVSGMHVNCDKLTETDMAAKIGSARYYQTLADAFAAATSGATITQLNDVTLNSWIYFTKTGNYTFDGNGKTITASSSNWDATYKCPLYLGDSDLTNTKDNTSFTVQNVNIETTGMTYALILDGCTATLTDSTITADGGTALCVNGRAEATVNATVVNTGSHTESWRDTALALSFGATADVTGGTYTSEYGWAIYIFTSGGTLNVADGVFEGAVTSSADGTAVNRVDAALNITGGVFYGGEFTTYANNGKTATITVSGGCYDEVLDDDFLAEGYIVTANTDYRTKTVCPYMVATYSTVTYTEPSELPVGVTEFTAPASFVYPRGNTAAISLKLPTVTYSADTIAFAGWVTNGSAAVISEIPVGATEDYVLVPTWKTVTKIEVVTGKDEKEDDILSDIKVESDWLETKLEEMEVTIAPSATEEEAAAAVSAALNTKEANNLTVWQNYVLGQDPTTAVAVDADQGETPVMPVKNTLATPTIDTGFEVKYSLDEVDAAGESVAEGEGEKKDTPDLTLDLATVTGSDQTKYYKMTATITKKDDDGVEVKVRSENTIGVMKVQSAAKDTILAVPWESLSAEGEDKGITVDNLVRTATLTAGDQIKAWDASTQTFKAWTLDDDGSWTPDTVVSPGAVDPGTDADAFTIPRGAGVWLTRNTDTTQPIYLVGGVATTEAAETPVEDGWNLVASPKTEKVDVKDIAADVKDQVVIPTEHAPKNITHDGVGWGYDVINLEPETITIGGMTFSVIGSTTRKYTDTNVPVGTGFWYIKGAGSYAESIKWEKED